MAQSCDRSGVRRHGIKANLTRTVEDVTGRHEGAPAVPAAFQVDESFCSNLFMSLQAACDPNSNKHTSFQFAPPPEVPGERIKFLRPNT
jgi:hypothetical protein